MYSETYRKGVGVDKEKVIDLINIPETEIFAVKSGVYEDGSEFFTITVDNIKVGENE